MRILIIEDELRLAEALEQLLMHNNYQVDLALDGEDGLYQALTGNHDMIVLDIMLPKRDGISLLNELRQQQLGTPIILLTAKSNTIDKVHGLDSGADDYLTKPFKTSELLARIRALSRRRGEITVTDNLVFADLEFNPHSLELWVGKQRFRLTKKEGQLLEYLINNQGRALSSTSIVQKVWGFDSDAEDNRVQVYISFLRKKLKRLGSMAEIRNIRSVGYLLAERADQRSRSEQ